MNSRESREENHAHLCTNKIIYTCILQFIHYVGYHYVMYICRLRLYTVYMISVEQSKVAQVSLSAEGVAASPSGESITFPRPIPGSVKVDKSK